MTRIKLTEDDFDDMDYSPIEIRVPDGITPREFCKQILDNEKIVDALFNFVKEEMKQSNYMTMKGDPISEECFKEAQKEVTIAIATINTIVERATGKPIKDL